MAFNFPKSKSGENGYGFKCEPTDRYTSYNLCQSVIEAFMKKQLGAAFSDCKGCISGKTCPAIKMIGEEKKAGKVIYWQDRHSKPIPAKVAPPEIDKDVPGERELIEKAQAGDSLHARAKFKAEHGIPANDVEGVSMFGKRPPGWWKAHMSEDDIEKGGKALEKRERQSAPAKSKPKKAARPVDPLGDAPSYADVVTKVAEKERRA